MSIGVHDFQIPHAHVQPTRDMVIIRIPLPPEKVGSVHVPQIVRDLAHHNVQAGRIVAMGPLAFSYKDETGLQRQEAKIGDWVVIRQYAGSLMQGGKLMVNSGWRYVSSFSDVIGLIPSEHMPDPSALLWNEDASQQAKEGAAVDLAAKTAAEAAAQFQFDNRKEA
jgi:co-chaperonin GroES (HSP10)